MGGTDVFLGTEEGYRQSSPFGDLYAVPTALERKETFTSIGPYGKPPWFSTLHA